MLSSSSGRSPARAVIAVCAALAAVPAVAGCGESGAGNAAGDPASLVPASAPLYAEAVVRPDGEQKARLESLLKRILRTDDPGAKLERTFDRSARKDGVTYERDIEPWLGKRAGAFLSGVTRGGDPQGGAVVATSDPDKALAALRKGEKPRGKKTYKGVEYELLSDGAAAAVGDFAVVGTEAAVRAVIDTHDSGKALSDVDRYTDARGEAGGDGLVIGYADPEGLLDMAARSGAVDPAALGAVRQAFAGAAGKAMGVSVDATDTGFLATGAVTGLPKSKSHEGDAAGAVAAVPRDAWLALGLGDVGGKIEDGLASASKQGGLGGIGIQTILDQLRQRSGIDLQRDVLSWMGDAAVFVRGTSGGSVGGALVVRSKDPAKSQALIGKLRSFLRSQNVPVAPLRGVAGVDAGLTVDTGGGPEVLLASAGNRFVAAVGRSSLVAALRPAGRLGSNPAFRRAAGQLGEGLRPTFFLDLPSVLRLVESSSKGSDSDYRKARPYLRAFTAIVAGAKRDGDVGRGKLFVGVR